MGKKGGKLSLSLPGRVPMGETWVLRGCRESAAVSGPGHLTWLTAVQSEKQWLWQGLWTELGVVFLLWLSQWFPM